MSKTFDVEEPCPWCDTLVHANLPTGTNTDRAILVCPNCHKLVILCSECSDHIRGRAVCVNCMAMLETGDLNGSGFLVFPGTESVNTASGTGG